MKPRAKRTTATRKIIFTFNGTTNGSAVSIAVWQPKRNDDGTWSARLRTSKPRSDAEITGVSSRQARELAFSICHQLFDGHPLIGAKGERIEIPGKEFPPPHDVDNGVRATRGITICLVDEGNGKSLLVLDDVRNVNGAWKKSRIYTQRRYPSKTIREGKLSDGQLANIGWVIVSRLNALESSDRKRRA